MKDDVTGDGRNTLDYRIYLELMTNKTRQSTGCGTNE